MGKSRKDDALNKDSRGMSMDEILGLKTSGEDTDPTNTDVGTDPRPKTIEEELFGGGGTRGTIDLPISGPTTEYRGTDFETTGPLEPGMSQYDIQRRQEERQSGWAALGNAAVNVAGEIGLGTVEGVGYLLDFDQHIRMLAGVEEDFGNALSDWSREMKDELKAVFPNYGPTETFEPGNFKWWMRNAPSVASSLSLLIPAMGGARLLSNLGRGLGMFGKMGAMNATSLAKAAKTSPKLKKAIEKFSKRMAVTEGVAAATMSRYMENTMEATETYETVYQDLIGKGKSTLYAKRKAGEAAARAWKGGLALLAVDMLQYSTLFKVLGRGKVGSNKIAKRAGDLAKNTGGEAGEEFYQFGLKEEAPDSRSSFETASKALIGNLTGKYADEPEYWTSGTLGALGGGVFYGFGQIGQRRMKDTGRRYADMQTLIQKGERNEAMREGGLMMAQAYRQNPEEARQMLEAFRKEEDVPEDVLDYMEKVITRLEKADEQFDDTQDNAEERREELHESINNEIADESFKKDLDEFFQEERMKKHKHTPEQRTALEIGVIDQMLKDAEDGPRKEALELMRAQRMDQLNKELSEIKQPRMNAGLRETMNTRIRQAMESEARTQASQARTRMSSKDHSRLRARERLNQVNKDLQELEKSLESNPTFDEFIQLVNTPSYNNAEGRRLLSEYARKQAERERQPIDPSKYSTEGGYLGALTNAGGWNAFLMNNDGGFRNSMKAAWRAKKNGITPEEQMRRDRGGIDPAQLKKGDMFTIPVEGEGKATFQVTADPDAKGNVFAVSLNSGRPRRFTPSELKNAKNPETYKRGENAPEKDDLAALLMRGEKLIIKQKKPDGTETNYAFFGKVENGKRKARVSRVNPDGTVEPATTEELDEDAMVDLSTEGELEVLTPASNPFNYSDYLSASQPRQEPAIDNSEEGRDHDFKESNDSNYQTEEGDVSVDLDVRDLEYEEGNGSIIDGKPDNKMAALAYEGTNMPSREENVRALRNFFKTFGPDPKISWEVDFATEINRNPTKPDDLMVTAVIHHEGKRYVVGQLKPDQLYTDPGQAAAARALKKELFDKVKAERKNKKGVMPKTGYLIADASARLSGYGKGRYMRISDRKATPKQLAAESGLEKPVLAVAGFDGNMQSGLESPIPGRNLPVLKGKPGAVYMLVTDTMGNLRWERLYTKKVSESKKLQEQINDVLRTVGRAAAAYERYKRVKGDKALTLEQIAALRTQEKMQEQDVPGEVAVLIREIARLEQELQSLVAWKDGPVLTLKTLSNELYHKNGKFSPQAYLDANDIMNKHAQVSMSRVNDGNYNESVDDLLYSNLAPDRFASPLFSVTIAKRTQESSSPPSPTTALGKLIEKIKGKKVKVRLADGRTFEATAKREFGNSWYLNNKAGEPRTGNEGNTYTSIWNYLRHLPASKMFSENADARHIANRMTALLQAGVPFERRLEELRKLAGYSALKDRGFDISEKILRQIDLIWEKTGPPVKLTDINAPAESKSPGTNINTTSLDVPGFGQRILLARIPAKEAYNNNPAQFLERMKPGDIIYNEGSGQQILMLPDGRFQYLYKGEKVSTASENLSAPMDLAKAAQDLREVAKYDASELYLVTENTSRLSDYRGKYFEYRDRDKDPYGEENRVPPSDKAQTKTINLKKSKGRLFLGRKIDGSRVFYYVHEMSNGEITYTAARSYTFNDEIPDFEAKGTTDTVDDVYFLSLLEGDGARPIQIGENNEVIFEKGAEPATIPGEKAPSDPSEMINLSLDEVSLQNDIMEITDENGNKLFENERIKKSRTTEGKNQELNETAYIANGTIAVELSTRRNRNGEVVFTVSHIVSKDGSFAFEISQDIKQFKDPKDALTEFHDRQARLDTPPPPPPPGTKSVDRKDEVSERTAKEKKNEGDWQEGIGNDFEDWTSEVNPDKGNTHTINEKEARKRLRKILGDKVSVEFIDELIELGSVKAWGTVRNGAVKLSRIAPDYTDMHEAFHIVTLNLIPRDKLNEVLDSAREVYGKPTEEQMNAKRKNYQRMVDANERRGSVFPFSLEEFTLMELLADEYADFMEARGKASNLPQKILQFLKDIYDRVRFMMGYGSEVERLFKKMAWGTFRNRPFIHGSNDTFTSQVEGLEAQEVSAAVSSARGLLMGVMNDVYNQQVRKDPTVTRNDVYQQLLAKTEVVQDGNKLKTVPKMSVLNAPGNPAKRDTVIARMVSNFVRMSNQYVAQGKKFSDQEMQDRKMKLLYAIRGLNPAVYDINLIQDQQTGEISIDPAMPYKIEKSVSHSGAPDKKGDLYNLVLHQMSLLGFEVRIGNFVTNTRTSINHNELDQYDEREEEQGEANTTGAVEQDTEKRHEVDENTISIMKKLSPQVRAFLAGIPVLRLNNEGNPQIKLNGLGQPVFSNPTAAYQYLQEVIGSTASWIEIEDRLRDRRGTKSTAILSQLNKMGPAKDAFLQEIWNSIGQRNKPDYYVMRQNSDGLRTEFRVITSSKSGIVGTLLNKVKLGLAKINLTKDNYNKPVARGDYIRLLLQGQKSAEILVKALAQLDIDVPTEVAREIKLKGGDALANAFESQLKRMILEDGNVGEDMSNVIYSLARFYDVTTEPSHLSIKMERVYDWVRSNHLGRTANSMRTNFQGWAAGMSRDQFYKRLPILGRETYWNTFRDDQIGKMFFLDGTAFAEDVGPFGKQYKEFKPRYTLATTIMGFLKEGVPRGKRKVRKMLMPVPVAGDSSTMAGITMPRFDDFQQASVMLEEVAKAEIYRIYQSAQRKGKSGIKQLTENGTKDIIFPGMKEYMADKGFDLESYDSENETDTSRKEEFDIALEGFIKDYIWREAAAWGDRMVDLGMLKRRSDNAIDPATGMPIYEYVQGTLDDRLAEWNDGDKPVNDFLESFAVNWALNHSQLHLITNGDPAFNKGKTSVDIGVDMYKRTKQILSPVNINDLHAKFRTINESGQEVTLRVPRKLRHRIQPDRVASDVLLDKLDENERKEKLKKYYKGEITLASLKQYSSDPEGWDNIVRIESLHGDKGREIVKRYLEAETTDGQTEIDLVSLRWREIGQGRWNQEKQEIWEALVRGELPLQGMSDLRAMERKYNEKMGMVNPIKPFVFGLVMNQQLDKLIPIHKKDSERVILPYMGMEKVGGVENPLYRPDAREMLEEMGYDFQENKYDFLDEEQTEVRGRKYDGSSFESTIKVALPEPDADGRVELDIPFDTWGRQQSTDKRAFLNARQKLGIQTMKLITTMDNNEQVEMPYDTAFVEVLNELRAEKDLPRLNVREGQTSTLTAGEIKEVYNEMLSRDLKDSWEELQENWKTNDFEGLLNMLRQQVITRGMGHHKLQALDNAPTIDETIGKINTKLPLWHPSHAYEIASLVNAVFRKRVSTVEPGGAVALYNASSFGMLNKNKPRIRWNDPDNPKAGIKHVEAYIPIHNRSLFKFVDSNGMLDMEAMKKSGEGQELLKTLEGFMYRIPTEDLYSMISVKVIGFIPSGENIVLLPDEVITMTGMDFDIDVMYGFFMQLLNSREEDILNAKENTPEGKSLYKAMVSSIRNVESQYDREVISAVHRNRAVQKMRADGATEQEIKDYLEKLAQQREQVERAIQLIQDKYEVGIGEIKLNQEELAEIDARRKQLVRDNARLSAMRALWSAPAAAARITNPQNFQDLTDRNDRFNNRTDYPGLENVSITSPMSYLEALDRMVLGKAVLGIYASANSHQAIMQEAETPIKVKPTWAKAHYIDSNGNTVSLDTFGRRVDETREGLTRLFGERIQASTDNTKDPQIERANISEYTVTVDINLTMLGVPQDIRYALLQQPIIRLLNRYYYDKGGYWKAEDEFVQMIKGQANRIPAISEQGFTEDWVYFGVDSSVALSKKQLEDGMYMNGIEARAPHNVQELIDMMVNNPEFATTQIKALQQFLAQRQAAEETSTLARAMRAGDKGTGVTMGQNVMKKMMRTLVANRKSRVMNSDPVQHWEGLDDFFSGDHYSNVQYAVIEEMMDWLATNGAYPHYMGDAFQNLMFQLMSYRGGGRGDRVLTNREIQQVESGLFDMMMGSTAFFDTDGSVVDKFPDKFVGMFTSPSHPLHKLATTNQLIASLNVEPYNTGVDPNTLQDGEINVLSLQTGRGEDAISNDELKNAFEELLMSNERINWGTEEDPDYQTVGAFARELVRYAFLRNGFAYSKGGFSHLIPPSFFARMNETMDVNPEPDGVTYRVSPTGGNKVLSHEYRRPFRLENPINFIDRQGNTINRGSGVYFENVDHLLKSLRNDGDGIYIDHDVYVAYRDEVHRGKIPTTKFVAEYKDTEATRSIITAAIKASFIRNPETLNAVLKTGDGKVVFPRSGRATRIAEDVIEELKRDFAGEPEPASAQFRMAKAIRETFPRQGEAENNHILLEILARQMYQNNKWVPEVNRFDLDPDKGNASIIPSPKIRIKGLPIDDPAVQRKLNELEQSKGKRWRARYEQLMREGKQTEESLKRNGLDLVLDREVTIPAVIRIQRKGGSSDSKFAGSRLNIDSRTMEGPEPAVQQAVAFVKYRDPNTGRVYLFRKAQEARWNGRERHLSDYYIITDPLGYTNENGRQIAREGTIQEFGLPVSQLEYNHLTEIAVPGGMMLSQWAEQKAEQLWSLDTKTAADEQQFFGGDTGNEFDSIERPAEEQIMTWGGMTSEEVMERLKPILGKLGVTVSSIEAWEQATGKKADQDTGALMDMVTKILAVRDGVLDIRDLPEEVSHLILETMEGDPTLDSIIGLVEQTEEWTRWSEEYRQKYTARDGKRLTAAEIERKVKKEIAGKVMSRILLNEMVREKENRLQRWFNRLWKKFLNFFRKAEVVELETMLETIARDTLINQGQNVDMSTLNGKYGSYDAVFRGGRKKKNAFDRAKASIVQRIQHDLIINLEAREKFLGNIGRESARRKVRDTIEWIEKDMDTRNQLAALVSLAKLVSSEIAQVEKNVLDKYPDRENNPPPADILKKLGDYVAYYQKPMILLMDYLESSEAKKYIPEQSVITEMLEGGPNMPMGIRTINDKLLRIQGYKEGTAASGMLKSLKKIVAERLANFGIDENMPDDQFWAKVKEITGDDFQQAAYTMTRDEGVLTRTFGALKHASDPILRALHSMLEKVTRRIGNRHKEFSRRYLARMKKDGFLGKSTKWMYEMYKGKKTGFLLTNRRIAEFQQAQRDYFEALYEKYDLPFEREARDQEMEAREKSNDPQVKAELRAYKAERLKWYQENTEKHPRYDEIVALKKQYLSKTEFQYWYSQNHLRTVSGKVIPRRELVQPSKKWENPAWNKLTQKQRDFIEYTIDEKMVLDLRIPGGNPLLAPQMELTGTEAIQERGGKAWLQQYERQFIERRGEDEQIYGEALVERADGSEVRRVPIYFHKRFGDYNESLDERIKHTDKITTDIGMAMSRYAGMSIKYEEMQEAAPDIEVILEGLGARKHIGKRGELQGQKTRAYQMAKTFIEMQVYGKIVQDPSANTIKIGKKTARVNPDNTVTYKRRKYPVVVNNRGQSVVRIKGKEYEVDNGKVEIYGREYKLDRIVDKFMAWVSRNNMAWNVWTAISNFGNSFNQSVQEAIIGEYYNGADFLSAQKEFFAQIQSWAEWNKPLKDHKLNVIMQQIGVFADPDMIWKNLQTNTNFRRVGRVAEGYWLFAAPDYYISGVNAIAGMKGVRYYKGKWITQRQLERIDPNYNKAEWAKAKNLYSVIKVKDGQIDFSSAPDPKLAEIAFDQAASKAKEVAEYQQGKISDLDRSWIHQQAFGRAVTTHRSWLISGLFRRLQGEGFNWQTLEREQGHYNWMINNISIEGVAKALDMFRNAKDYPRHEVIAAKRLMITTMSSIVFLLVALFINGGWPFEGDDEEEGSTKFGGGSFAGGGAGGSWKSSSWGGGSSGGGGAGISHGGSILGKNYAANAFGLAANRVFMEVGAFSILGFKEIMFALQNPVVAMGYIDSIAHLTDAFSSEAVASGPWEGVPRWQKWTTINLIPGTKSVMHARDPGTLNNFFKNKVLSPFY